MKEQTIGVEVEMTGITREQAAMVVANYLNANIEKTGDGYDTYNIIASDQRIWKVMRDSSIRTMKKETGKWIGADGTYSVELVTPILTYDEDIEILQEIIRRLRKAGATSDSEYQCGIHIHIGANNHTPITLKNLVNLMASKEELIYKSLEVEEDRVRYCKKINENLIETINHKKPKTLKELADIWYSEFGAESRGRHYHSSRYHGLNLHSTFTKGTIEFRLFNGTLHAGKIRSYIVFCLAVSHQALKQRSAIPRRTIVPNEKYAFRCWLLRLGLSGDEFKNCRKHLMANLTGDAAFKMPRAM